MVPCEHKVNGSLWSRPWVMATCRISQAMQEGPFFLSCLTCALSGTSGMIIPGPWTIIIQAAWTHSNIHRIRRTNPHTSIEIKLKPLQKQREKLER